MDPSTDQAHPSNTSQQHQTHAFEAPLQTKSPSGAVALHSVRSEPFVSNQNGTHQENSPSGSNRSGVLCAVKKIWACTLRVGQTVLRSLGLSLIIHAFTSIRYSRGRGLHEQTKIAIRKNRAIALLRSLIHLVPVGGALGEITLTWNTYYLGAQVYNLALYQIVAKIHEMMIQASLAAILFSYVRYEMAIGEGIPFGALFSGLQINQISYIWSMEFWGSLRSRHLSGVRKLKLLAIVLLSVVLATVSGPSSAVLLIPRLELWPAGSTHIWINATFDELWPDRLDGSSVPAYCSVSQEHSVSNGCPSSEWQAFRDFISISSQVLPEKYMNAYGTTETPTLRLTGKISVRKLDMGIETLPSDEATTCTTQQAAIADALTSTGALWFLALNNVTAKSGHGASPADQSNAIHRIQLDSYQPFSLADCFGIVIKGVTDNGPVAFPYIASANQPAFINVNMTSPESHFDAILHPSLTRQQILDTPGPTSDYRLKWVELPQPIFNGSTIGAVVLPPRSESEVSQQVFLCNLAAGWGTTALQMQTLAGGTGDVSSQTILHGKPIENNKAPLGKYPSDPAGQVLPADFDFEYPNYPQRPISVTSEWAEFLNPTVPNSNTSVFNILMREKLWPLSSAQVALAAMMANGLARTSFTSELQGSVKTSTGRNGSADLDGNFWVSGKGDVFVVNPDESRDWVKLRVDSYLEGYAYNTTKVSSRIAIGILMVYCLLATRHVFYAGITGISSTCWDSIAEVTALAMNSSPTATLRNTCAGIAELHIFKLPVRILAARDLEGEGEHLELVFGAVHEEKSDKNTIQPNRAYGTMPSLHHRKRSTQQHMSE